MKLRPRVMSGTTSMAKGEAFSGFHTKNSVFPKSKTGHRASRSTSHPPGQDSKLVKVGTVMMIPFGLNPTGSLRSKKKPGKSELETYHQYGLVVDADGEKDLEFNTSWSVVDIDMWFWRLLPKAFKWLDARRGPLDIHWVLLNSDRLNLFILTQPTITGKELDEVKGSASRSIMSRSIAIAPRIPISFTVYSNWDSAIHRSSHPSMLAHRTQDILTISDSKSDDLDDCHAGGTADEISDYSSDIAAPTRARKNKGKGKAVAVPINTLIKLTESDCEFQIVAGSAGPLTIKPTCYR
ncbi:hypothetical protein V8E55_004076, partial [Tylopilus felleus]